ncbi:MAG: hypothetical protein JO112_12015 [Planctomycetes bacterium]|nr:hypothetical protein [Planctomycetota bacterium]
MPATLFLILLFIAWVNYHGMVLFGVVLLGLTAVVDFLQDRGSSRSYRLAVLTGLSGWVVLLNPYNIDYWKAFAPLGGATLTTIYEWKPVWAPPQAEVEILAAIGVLTLFALLAWAINPRRRWSHLGWLGMMGVCFLRARRFIWLLALVDLAVLAANARVLEPEALWAELWRRHSPEAETRKEPPPIPPRWRTLFRIGVAVWLLGFLGLRVANMQPPPQGISLVPEGPARFIRDHRLPGNGFNDYENSSYLDWYFGGQPPLFIDLLNAYPDQVLLDYHAIRMGTPQSQELLKQYQIGYVVLTTFRNGAPLKPLADLLDRNSEEWVHVYAGREGHIWVRRTSEYEYLWGPLEHSS